ncbi:hypothetical protein CHU98_g7802 [Xylaria longipes]|nr:hypothetical protein CHU98_g7802 [Xylaria longipes]
MVERAAHPMHPHSSLLLSLDNRPGWLSPSLLRNTRNSSAQSLEALLAQPNNHMARCSVDISHETDLLTAFFVVIRVKAKCVNQRSPPVLWGAQMLKRVMQVSRNDYFGGSDQCMVGIALQAPSVRQGFVSRPEPSVMWKISTEIGDEFWPGRRFMSRTSSVALSKV